MGELQKGKGILGGFSGMVGSVVGASWRGKDVMRSRPRKNNKPATVEQLAVRLKFRLVTKFLAPINLLLADFFGQPEGYKSRRDLATSYHINEAIAGSYPDFEIDFDKVIIAMGTLLSIEQPTVTPTAGAGLDISWADNSGQAGAAADDKLLVVVYNPDRNQYAIRQEAARAALAYSIDLPTAWAAETVHCWATFVTAEGKEAATSVYLGPQLLI